MTHAVLDDHLLRDLLTQDRSEDGPAIRACAEAIQLTYWTVAR